MNNNNNNNNNNSMYSINNYPSLRPGTVLLAHPMLNLTLFRFSCILITDVDPEHGTKGVIVNLPYTEYIRQENSAMKFWHDDLSYSYLRESLVPFTEDMMKETGFEGDFHIDNKPTDTEDNINNSNNNTNNIYYHQDNHHSSSDLNENVDNNDGTLGLEKPIAFDDTLVQDMKESMWDEYGQVAGSKIDSVVSQILHSAAISPLIKDEQETNREEIPQQQQQKQYDNSVTKSSSSPISKEKNGENNSIVDDDSSMNLQEGLNVGSQLGFSQRVMLHYGGPFEERQSTFLIRDRNKRLLSSLESMDPNSAAASALKRVNSDLFLCRDVKSVQDVVRTQEIPADDIKALQGCVMWEPGQLEKETFRENLWFTFNMPSSLLTQHSSKEQQLMWMWSNAMKSVGGEYRHLGNWYSKLLPNGCMMNISTKEIASNILRSLPQAELGSIRTK